MCSDSPACVGSAAFVGSAVSVAAPADATNAIVAPAAAASKDAVTDTVAVADVGAAAVGSADSVAAPADTPDVSVAPAASVGPTDSVAAPADAPDDTVAPAAAASKDVVADTVAVADVGAAAVDSADSVAAPTASASDDVVADTVTAAVISADSVATSATASTATVDSDIGASESVVVTQTPTQDELYSKEEIRSLMDEYRVQIKNELKAESMGQRINDLASAFEILQKENNLLKKEKRDMYNDMNSKIKGLQTQVNKLNATIKSMIPNSPEVIILSDVDTNGNVCNPTPTADKMQAATQQLSSPIPSAARPTSHQPSEHTPHELSSPPSSPSSSSLHANPKARAHDDEIGNNGWELFKKRPSLRERRIQRHDKTNAEYFSNSDFNENNASFQHPSPTSSPSSPVFNRDSGKRNASLKLSSPPPSPSSLPRPSTTPKDFERSKKRLSPGERLAQRRVKPDTTRVLIGDSVFLPLKPELMFPNSTCENISEPGLAVHEACHWLANIPACPNVIQCVFHLGINTCGRTSTSIPSSEWSSLIKLAKKVFPNAQISFSSIILPRSGEPLLKKSVNDSNHTLKLCCTKLECTFIDNDIIFRTANGAPRKALYRDNVHPSGLGTGRLACHIKNGGKPYIQQSKHPIVNVDRDYPSSNARMQQQTTGLLKTPPTACDLRHNFISLGSRPFRHPPPYLNAMNRRQYPQAIPSFGYPLKHVRFTNYPMANPFVYETMV